MPTITYDTTALRADDYYVATQNGGWQPYTTFTTNKYTCATETIVTSSQLEKAIRKIYEIIKEHTMLDISEEEFMRVIKDDG